MRLLEIIQGNLERIHADLPDPKPVAELELAGLPGIYRPVADLEAAELGKQQVAVATLQGQALVEPTPQLNQASEPQARGDARVPLGAFTNSQVGQALTNCTNTVQQQAPGDRKDLLEELVKQVQQLIAALPAEKQDEALQVAENLERLVKQASSAKPNRKWYSQHFRVCLVRL